MENATLTISMPRPMKNFIAEKVREGQFSTPSEYIRSLIRADQERRRTASAPDDRNAGVGA
jgi:antitoxin ParD1/3/4